MDNTEKLFNGYVIATIFMIVSAVLIYITFDTLYGNHVLNKQAFLCTKVEQTGKNLDDVTCVQYTQHKHYQQAIALNKSIEAVNNATVAELSPKGKKKK